MNTYEALGLVIQPQSHDNSGKTMSPRYYSYPKIGLPAHANELEAVQPTNKELIRHENNETKSFKYRNISDWSSFDVHNCVNRRSTNNVLHILEFECGTNPILFDRSICRSFLTGLRGELNAFPLEQSWGKLTSQRGLSPSLVPLVVIA